MIIKFDFGNDYVQYISCSTKVGRRINKIQREFFDWIFDEEKNKKYWAYKDGKRHCLNYDADAIIDWLNHVKFTKGVAKARLLQNPQGKVKKTVYF
ncbi:hypothetical protein ACSFXN_07105 [Planococcus sp. 1R117A]|uniref:hypothetical protein n=1 Tax=Planococcus sp. 1R117A TaxID=3447020 RepID=UPI003EDC5D3D